VKGHLLLWAAWLAVAVPLFLARRALIYDDHLEPAARILETGAVPAPDDCWECHQPPLYYLMEVGLFAWLGAGTASERLEAARLLTDALMVVLWLLGALLVRRWFTEPRRRLMALLFYLTLPAFVLLHVLLSNDVLVIALAAALFLAATRVLASPAARASAWAWGQLGALAAVMFLAKYNGLAALPALAAAAWLANTGKRRWLLPLAVGAGFLALTGPWAAWNMQRLAKLPPEPTTPAGPRFSLGEPIPLRMHGQDWDSPPASYFLSFRLADLLAEPFTDDPRATYLDLLGDARPCDLSLPTRTYSLLFNESLHYLPPLPPPLVSALYLFGLLLLVTGAVGLWVCLKQAPGGVIDRFAALFALASLALLLAFNWAYPSPHLVHGKAVFLMPAWPAWVLIHFRGLEHLTRDRGTWARVTVYSAHWILQGLFVAHAVALALTL
jgi:4-amino-4-deoxy-L-arabinose transferase-like glycosyltransferase